MWICKCLWNVSSLIFWSISFPFTNWFAKFSKKNQQSHLFHLILLAAFAKFNQQLKQEFVFSLQLIAWVHGMIRMGKQNRSPKSINCTVAARIATMLISTVTIHLVSVAVYALGVSDLSALANTYDVGIYSSYRIKPVQHHLIFFFFKQTQRSSQSPVVFEQIIFAQTSSIRNIFRSHVSLNIKIYEALKESICSYFTARKCSVILVNLLRVALASFVI